jgi:diguanylate cyclase (GGDEF)-like protein
VQSRRQRLVVTLPDHPIALGAVTFLAYATMVELFYLAFLFDDLTASLDPVATFFPPAGLALALFLRSAYPRWPVLVGSIWAAEVTVDLLNGVTFGDTAVWGAANTVEPMIGAALIRHLFRSEQRHAWGSLRNLMLFVGSAVLVGPAVGAAIASMTGPVDDPAALVEFWLHWWVGDGIGVMVIAPVLLLLGDRRQPERRWRATLLGVVALAVALTLGPVPLLDQTRAVYLLFPVLVGVAFMGGLRTTAASVLIVGLAANLGTLWGYGPFVEPGTPFNGLVDAQIFVGTLAFSALFVGVLGANLIHRDTAEVILRAQARTDLLTGIGNRRMLFERLDEMRMTGLLAPRDRIAFLLADLDGFKQVNDALGHEAGDQVLKVTADRMTTATRSDDIVVRLGGDEFLICLTNTSSSEEARAAADRLSCLLAEPILVGAETVKVTASIGVADGLFGDFDRDKFLHRADQDMYSRKNPQSPDSY